MRLDTRDTMGWKKVAAVGVIIILTSLNVWLVSNIIRSSPEHLSVQSIRKPQVSTKLSDILVIPIDDIHPIDHLKEAKAIERQHQSSKDVQAKVQPRGPTAELTVTYASANEFMEVDPETFAQLKVKLEYLKASILSRQFRSLGQTL